MEKIKRKLIKLKKDMMELIIKMKIKIKSKI